MNIRKLKDGKAGILICAFLLPFVMMQIFWAICGIYPFGDGSILAGDMNIEFVNFYAYFINTFKTKNDWSYMLAKTLGGDFPGLAAFQLHDPLLFLLFLFPGDRIAAGIELIFTLQISIAGLTTSILLNNRYKRSWMSLLFSTGYAFCSFFFGYLVLTIYFGALSILPLAIYCFLNYLDDKKHAVSFIITSSFFIFLNYHMGFMLVIFFVILYVSKIISDTSYLKRLPDLAISAMTVILIDGYFLVRTGLSLLGEKTTDGADYGFYRRFPLNQLFAGMFSGTARNDLRPLIYCSVAAFFFAVVYFASPKFSFRKKLANAFVIASVAISMWINTFDAVWHGFNNPEGFYWRYAYYISIMVIVLGYQGFVYLTDETEDSGKKTRTIIISALIIAAYMLWLLIMGNPYLGRMGFVINFAIALVAIAAAFVMTKEAKMRTLAFSALLAVSVAEMLYNAKTAYVRLNLIDGIDPKMSAFVEDYHDIDDVIKSIKSYDDGFYRIEKDFDRAINDPAMFDYIGLSHDSSCEKDEILDWLINFGFCKTVYYTYYNGGSTAFVDDLFGVRYYVSRFDSIEKPYEHTSYEGKYHAYKNDDALPMAYIAPEGLVGEDLVEGNTFQKQNRIASYWNDTEIFTEADHTVTLEGATEDGEGHFVKTGDEGYIVYNISVTSENPLYFYFYAPGRQNGRVFVNDAQQEAYFTVNHWNTLCAGRYKIGDTVTIRMQIVDDELTISEACFYYEHPKAIEEWAKAAKKLNEPIGDVEEITSSNLRFTADLPEDRTVIVSLPYEEDWKVTCDGEVLEAGRALGMLESFDVPAGKHTIEMKYTPKGTAAGLILSLIGLALLILRVHPICDRITREK